MPESKAYIYCVSINLAPYGELQWLRIIPYVRESMYIEFSLNVDQVSYLIESNEAWGLQGTPKFRHATLVEDFATKSPRSESSAHESRSEYSWNNPSDTTPCRKTTAFSMKGSHAEDFGPWDNGRSDSEPEIVQQTKGFDNIETGKNRRVWSLYLKFLNSCPHGT